MNGGFVEIETVGPFVKIPPKAWSNTPNTGISVRRLFKTMKNQSIRAYNL